MKYCYLLLCVLILPFCASAQTVLWEKVLGSNVADFLVRDAVRDSEGNFYLVGKYETGLAFFTKDENGNTMYADSTLPYETQPFVWKMNPEGELLKRTFLPGIGANNILRLSDNRFVIAGFMNNYREKNYANDRGQGVFSVQVDSALQASIYKTYPDFMNSLPQEMIADAAGGFIIIAYSESLLRLIHANNQGEMLRDTTFSHSKWFERKFVHHDSFSLHACTEGEGSTFWVAGKIAGEATTGLIINPIGLVQFDFDFQRIMTGIFGNKEGEIERPGFLIEDLSASGQYVFAIGMDTYAGLESFAILFDLKGNVLYKQPLIGSITDPLVTVSIDETHWAVLSADRTGEFRISVFDPKGLVKELKFPAREGAKPKVLIADKQDVYAVGEVKEGEVRKIWMARIKF